MSSHLVKKFFLHALARKQVLFVGLAYKKYSYVRCNVVFTSERNYPQSHNHTFVFFDYFEKYDTEKKLYFVSKNKMKAKGTVLPH